MALDNLGNPWHIQPEGYGEPYTKEHPLVLDGKAYWPEGLSLMMRKLQEEPVSDSDVVLRLTTEEALSLATVLDNARTDALLLALTSDTLNDKFAARLFNSAIDPIISQLEAELEQLGVR